MAYEGLTTAGLASLLDEAARARRGNGEENLPDLIDAARDRLVALQADRDELRRAGVDAEYWTASLDEWLPLPKIISDLTRAETALTGIMPAHHVRTGAIETLRMLKRHLSGELERRKQRARPAEQFPGDTGGKDQVGPPPAARPLGPLVWEGSVAKRHADRMRLQVAEWREGRLSPSAIAAMEESIAYLDDVAAAETARGARPTAHAEPGDRFVMIPGWDGRDDWREPSGSVFSLERDHGALARVVIERIEQLTRWGPHCDGHTPLEWLGLVGKQVGAASQAANERHYRGAEADVANHALRQFQGAMASVAALAVGAIGWAIRERETPKDTGPEARHPDEV